MNALRPLFLFAVSALMLVTALSAPATESPARRKIAVIEFDAVNPEAKHGAKGRMASEIFTTAAVKTGVFDVVERHLIEKIMAEMEFGAGVVSGSNAQKIGALVGADAVLTGAVTEYRGELRIDARMIAVSDGKILLADEEFAKDDLLSISTASNKIMWKMAAVLAPDEAARLAVERGETPALSAPDALKAPDGTGQNRPAPETPKRRAQAAAPGFTPNMAAGVFDTSFKTLTLTVKGETASGTYTYNQGGVVEGKFDGAILAGIWAEKTGQVACPQKRKNTAYWGALRFTFEDGGRVFNGVYDYCGQGKNFPWTGVKHP